MSLPNTQKIPVIKGDSIEPKWYNAVLIGHVEKDNNGIISSHIEFRLIDNNKQVWAILPHNEINLARIKRLKQALAMADEETDLAAHYNKRLRIYINNVCREGAIINDIEDFEKLNPETGPASSGYTQEIRQQPSKKIPRQILIVDDQPEVATLIGNYVEQIGFTPDIVVTVDDAIDKFDPGKYLMIISDVIMPGKNGFDLVRCLHNDYPDVTVALISGYFDKEMENLQKLFGIEKIYRKPVFFKSVKEMVAIALKKLTA